jgi:hypothetical protein
VSPFCLLQDKPVLDVKVSLPRLGVWHADVSVDSPELLSGRVTLALDGFELSGTIRHGGVTSDTGLYRLAAGGGGLNTSATPKAYNSTTARIVLQDLLATAGETLSPSVDSSLLAALLPFWVTTSAPVGFQVAQVAAAVGADAWRVLPDGTLWLGMESWPVETPSTLNVSAIDTRLRRFRCGLADGGMVLPGTCYQDAANRVSYVKVVSENASRLEAEVWLE